MGRKKLLILALCIIGIIVTSLFIWNNMQIPLKYQKNIYRDFETQEEKTALNVAESLDYSSILSKDRFPNLIDPQAYLHPGTYLDYQDASFIDSVVIDYYETRYDYMQGKGDPRQIELDYQANVSKSSEFRIYNSRAPEGASWHNITIVMSAPNGSVSFNSGHMQFFYRNQSSYQMVEWEYDFNFSDCYVVEMKLGYCEIYAPTAAFFVNVYQIVVFDEAFDAVLVGVESGMAVS